MKNSVKKSVKKPSRINRQRRLQKQLQALLLERHSRRCIICHHPEREAIEEEFVHWRAPWKLSQDYKLADYRTVYRHARAAGLLLQRRERLHSALDAFVESVDDVTFTGDTILRAMRAYSCIDSHGRWTEIPTQVQFSTSNDGHPSQPSPPALRMSVPMSSTSTMTKSQKRPEEDEENPPEERVTALDVLNVIRKYSNQASRSDAHRLRRPGHPRKPSTPLKINPTNSKTMTPTPTRNQKKTQKKNRKRTRDEERPLALQSTSRSDTIASPASPQSQSHSDNTALLPPLPNRRHAATLPLAQPHPRKHCRETLFAARIRMTGRPPTAPIAPLCPDLQRAHPRNRLPLKNRSRTPTASYGTNAPAIWIRRSPSQMPRAASRTKST